MSTYPLWFLLLVTAFALILTFAGLVGTSFKLSTRLGWFVLGFAFCAAIMLVVDIGPQLLNRIEHGVFVKCGYGWDRTAEGG